MIQHDTVYVGAQAMPQCYWWFNFHFDLKYNSPSLPICGPSCSSTLFSSADYTLQFMMHFAQVK